MDKENFLEYLTQEFPTVANNHFVYDLLENIIDYGIKNHNATISDLQWFLSDIIPEVTEEEIKRFITE